MLAVLAQPQDRCCQSRLAGALAEKAEQPGPHRQPVAPIPDVSARRRTRQNAAARSIEAHGKNGAGLQQVLRHDMELLWPYLHIPTSSLTSLAVLDDYAPARPVSYEYLDQLCHRLQQAHSAEEGTDTLLEQYCRYGAGQLARYIAFRVNTTGRLTGIENFPGLTSTI